MRRRVFWCLLLAIGPLAMAGVVLLGYAIVAPIFLIPVLIGLRLVGWAEVDNEHLRHERLIGASNTIAFSEIREVGLGMDVRSAQKWWYPEVETTAGTSVAFVMLKSRSGKEAVASVEAIFGACVERMPDEAEDSFTTVTASDDGELEFFLSPGYDAYLREKADNPDAAPVEVPVDEAPIQHTPMATRPPHQAFCDDAPQADEDAPEVFTPRALTDRRRGSLTVVNDEYIERSRQDRREAPGAALPAVVIEAPATQVVPPPQIAVHDKPQDRQFTSLFRRTS